MKAHDLGQCSSPSCDRPATVRDTPNPGQHLCRFCAVTAMFLCLGGVGVDAPAPELLAELEK